jgi:hypothetical protein
LSLALKTFPETFTVSLVAWKGLKVSAETWLQIDWPIISNARTINGLQKNFFLIVW